MFIKLKSCIANRILFLLFYFAWRRFWNTSMNVESIQNKYLNSIISHNAQTKFGRNFNFSSINNVSDFQRLVPISQYEDYVGFMEEIRNKNHSILTQDKIRKFSLSSGTATASKLIPNTQTLINEFDKCISVWLFDLYRNIPALLNGRSFWIITPSTKTEQYETGIKKGFEDDSEYFSPVKQWFIRNIFAVPNEVAQFCEGENYYFALAVFLLADSNLRLISVWNPSVFLILLDKIQKNQITILESLASGKLNFPESINTAHRNILEKKLKCSSLRIKYLHSIFDVKMPSTKIWTLVWPKLAVISSWDSAWASQPACTLKNLFPNAIFQGKGLLATEACVTFPVFSKDNNYQYIPAYTSHFFEFESITSKKISLLHQLQDNERYEVIVTTGGGLYRYRLNDVVECYGFTKGLPLLRFEGKSNLISDIMGEKLHESHVNCILQSALNELDIQSIFHFLAPEISTNSTFYTLFIQSKNNFNKDILIKKIEAGLCENFHYKHCRVLGQLAEVQVCMLNNDSVSSFYAIQQTLSHLGSSKQLVLRKETFWRLKFAL